MGGITFTDSNNTVYTMTPATIMANPSIIMSWAQANLVAKMNTAVQNNDQFYNGPDVVPETRHSWHFAR